MTAPDALPEPWDDAAATPPASAEREHEPGENHDYAPSVCRVCGQHGYVRVSIEPQRTPATPPASAERDAVVVTVDALTKAIAHTAFTLEADDNLNGWSAAVHARTIYRALAEAATPPASAERDAVVAAAKAWRVCPRYPDGGTNKQMAMYIQVVDDLAQAVDALRAAEARDE